MARLVDAFEVRLAWRHLRAREGGRWVVAVGALGVHSALVGAFLIGWADALAAPPELTADFTPIAADVARILGLVTLGGGLFVAVFAALTALFNLLSAIIVLSVAQGCMALVIVLSLMTGLELDLRSKILDQRAEIRISREDGEAFVDYERLLEALAASPEIADASPYVEGEVMLRSDYNRQGALLVGVDPERHRRVTGLASMIRGGDYGFLSDPDAGPWEEIDLLRAARDARVADFNARSAAAATIDDASTTGEIVDASTTSAIVDAPTTGTDEPEEADDGGWEEPAAALGTNRGGDSEADTPAPADASADADDPDDEAWEDPSVEIPRLRAAGEIPPASPVGAPTETPPADDAADDAPSEPADAAAEAPVTGASEVPLLLGQELAEELGVDFGERVQVITPVGRMTPQGPVPSAMSVRVVALFHSGMYAYDHRNLYVPLDRAQAFLRLGPRAHGVDVRLVAPDRLDEGVAAARDAVARAGVPGLRVESWRVLHRNVFTAMLLEKIAMFIGLLFVVLVAAFGILATNLMSVLDKAQQIAILKAMGASDRSIARVFMLEGLVVGILGAALGIGVGLVVCALLEQQGIPLSGDSFSIQRLPVVVDPREVALVGAAALVIVWLSSVHPARTAARMRPVDGLRQGD